MKTLICLLSIVLLVGCQSNQVKSLQEDNALLQKKCDLLEMKVDYLLIRDSVVRTEAMELYQEDLNLWLQVQKMNERDVDILEIIRLHERYNH